MVITRKFVVLPKEWAIELEKYVRKCDLTSEEREFIAKLAKECNIPPWRVIATIALNATLEEKEMYDAEKRKLYTKKFWCITNETITKYENALSHYEKGVRLCREYLDELKATYKEPKGIGEKILKWLGFIPTPESVENNLKDLEACVQRYKNIVKILSEAQSKIILTDKIKRKSGFKRMDNTL